MIFIDDMAGVDADSQIQVESSQRYEQSSEPPRKRRRVQHYAYESDREERSRSSSHTSLELPSHDQDYPEIDEEILGEQINKYEEWMYEPRYVESQKNQFVTQVNQPWSSPTRIRGPRWRKRSSTPSSGPTPGSTTNVICSPPRVEASAQTSILPGVSVSKQASIMSLRDEFGDDELDAYMIAADEAQITGSPLDKLPAPVRRQASSNMRQMTLFGTNMISAPRATQSRAQQWRTAERNESPTHHKLNEDALERWIFPLNAGTVRDYQFNIVHKSLFNNILVALPTGLGKTFIAAAVMMNWFRWTQNAQIVFMAPTKPLTAQQVEACFHIAGIPRSQTTLMTGEISPVLRAEEWRAKRVFFMTPQTFHNDLTSGIADPKRIVLIVVDEAHKATGNYAYVQVASFLRRFNTSFRILALTATPGATVEAVQKVIDGLEVARTEIRTEDSLDIRSFVHQRNVELELFEYSEEVSMCMDLFGKAVKPVMDKLTALNAYWSKDPLNITLFGLMESRRKWFASDAGRSANQGVKAMIHACFTPLMGLAHNLELLKFHGIGPFYSKMKAWDSEQGNGKYVKMITQSEHYMTMMTRVRAWVSQDDFIGHPKLSHLNSVILNHFMDAGAGVGRASGRPPSDTRIMVFTHYRESAEEITRILNRHQPMVRAHVFVGQSDTKNSSGMDQKAQTDVIKKFKEGVYNTLIATSIGEEGLDIGEVDLIVCYDCSKSPIRMLQRMGRTGRKRTGNIVMLLMRGKEEKNYHEAKDNYSKMQEIIESGERFNYHSDKSMRIVPKHINPVVSKEHVEIPVENTQADATQIEPRKNGPLKKAKKPPKRFNMPDDVETGFRFLGKKKKNIPEAESVKVSKSKRVFVDEDDSPLPDLTDTLLNGDQAAKHESKYASVAGEETEFIRQVNLERNPETIRKLSCVQRVGHSIYTHNIVNALQLARTQAKYNQHPRRPAGVTPARPVGNRKWEPTATFTQEEGRDAAADVPFFVSQQSGQDAPSQSQALEDLDNLFESRTTSKQASKPATVANTSRSRRRVVSDDDDDEG